MRAEIMVGGIYGVHYRWNGNLKFLQKSRTTLLERSEETLSECQERKMISMTAF